MSNQKDNAQVCVVDDVDDPVIKMIEKTGCAKYHEAVQECYAEHQDWRPCQAILKEFRLCMQAQQRSVSHTEKRNE